MNNSIGFLWRKYIYCLYTTAVITIDKYYISLATDHGAAIFSPQPIFFNCRCWLWRLITIMFNCRCWLAEWMSSPDDAESRLARTFHRFPWTLKFISCSNSGNSSVSIGSSLIGLPPKPSPTLHSNQSSPPLSPPTSQNHPYIAQTRPKQGYFGARAPKIGVTSHQRHPWTQTPSPTLLSNQRPNFQQLDMRQSQIGLNSSRDQHQKSKTLTYVA